MEKWDLRKEKETLCPCERKRRRCACKSTGKTKDGEVGPTKGKGDVVPLKGTGKTKDGEVGPTKGKGDVVPAKGTGQRMENLG